MSLHQKVLPVLLIVLFYNEYVNSETRIDPLVSTKVGLIRGLQAEDGDYYKFLGIPYAKVNESNPFGVSSAYPDFEDVYEAYNDLAECPQVEEEFYDIFAGSPGIKTLDCLNLNVFVPSSANSKNLLPVLVFIHGGAYTAGSGRSTIYDPRYMVKQDIVFVSLNYRLGPYGFMCLGNSEVPGNQGLKDQLLALQWIKANIEAFGGNPNKITLSGQSAGAMTADFQIYSRAEKLFNQAILQSGSALMPEAPLEPNNESTLKLAEILGYNTSDVSDALAFLITTDPALVVVASQQLPKEFFPCVERDLNDVEEFITDYPINLNIPKVKDMPIMIGFTSKETPALFISSDIYDDLKFAFIFDDEELEHVTKMVRHFYFGDEEYVLSDLTDYNSDFIFNYPPDRSVTKYLENGAKDVFYYMFSYIDVRNWMPNDGTGAVHSDELFYLFYTTFFGEVTDEQQLIIDRMTTLWTNFVKYGNPTPEQTDLLPITWEAVTPDSKFYMNLDTELTVSTRPYNERMSFWDLIFRRYRESQRGYRRNDIE